MICVVGGGGELAAHFRLASRSLDSRASRRLRTHRLILARVTSVYSYSCRAARTGILAVRLQVAELFLTIDRTVFKLGLSRWYGYIGR